MSDLWDLLTFRQLRDPEGWKEDREKGYREGRLQRYEMEKLSAELHTDVNPRNYEHVKRSVAEGREKDESVSFPSYEDWCKSKGWKP